MLNMHWLEESGTSRKDFCIVFVLLFNVFTWYYMILMMLEGIPWGPDLKSAFRTVFFIVAIGSGIAGSIVSERIERLHILYLWMTLGAFSSFLLIFIYNVTIGHLSMIFLLLGFSFGFGMPSCLAYLADHTKVENRGRVSSVPFLAANVGALPLVLLFSMISLPIASLILTVWRGLGLIILVLLKPGKGSHTNTEKSTHFVTIFHNRSFVLYLVPWMMFSLIDILGTAIVKKFVFEAAASVPSNFYELTVTVGPIIASLSMLIGGILADRIGRKRVVIYGFVSLGIAYAVVGVAPTIATTLYFYLVIDGIAAGILWITFILILWGDLSQPGAREKYYAIGSFPFLARNITPILFLPLIALVPNANAAFSLASFFLFLAVVPLMYAPETLPASKIELRRVKGYLEAAKKVKEKYVVKG